MMSDVADVLPPTSVDELQRGIYQRAKLNPDGRFQDIYDAICREDVLQHAYLLCRARNTHAPGVDGKVLADIASYGARKWLKELEADLRARNYRPAALLRVTIPQPNHQFRSKDIATLRDEVCMTAAMLIMEPLIAAWLITKPETDLSIDQNQLHQTPGWLAYLAAVSHTELTQRLALLITDHSVLNLFTLWLACPIAGGDSANDPQSGVEVGIEGQGISNDLPISPLLTYLVAPGFLLQHQNDATAPGKHRGEIGNAGLPTAKPPIKEQDSPRKHSVWTQFRETQIGKALLLSLLFHAALLAIEFGEPGTELPFFGSQGESRPANIPMLTATLRPLPQPDAVTPLPSTVEVQKTKRKKRKTPKSIQRPKAQTVIAASPTIKGFKAVVAAPKMPGPAPVEPTTSVLKPPKVDRPGVEVLSAKSESTWSRPVVPPVPEEVVTLPADPPADTKAEEESKEKERLVALEQIESDKAEHAAAAKAQEDALALQRAEDMARVEAEKLKQAAAAKAKAKADELAHAQVERQRQAAIASAREEALAQQGADELARTAVEKIRLALEAKAAAERNAKKALAEAEALARDRAAKEDALARQRAEELARVEAEKLRLAAAKAKQEELVRVEAERQRQVALARAKEEAQARQRAEELARIEAEKARQVQEAKAAAEQIAKRAEAEAEALARERAIEAAAQAKKLKAEKALAAEQARAAQIAAAASATGTQSAPAAGSTPSLAAGKGREDSAAQATGTGRDLVSRALDAARNPSSGLLPLSPAETLSPRRASILGRDPKDIQLAFYGEGWRQKVERIGAMNFPKLSKFLTYDPMVVTVSINSDGTLAGVRIVKSSGHVELDNAVRRIIEMSAPFSAFPPDMKRVFDVADITRTWVFVGDRPQINRD